MSYVRGEETKLDRAAVNVSKKTATGERKLLKSYGQSA